MLPDRTPVKLSTTLTPTLAARLRDYADFYAETYGTREEVADLIPFMLRRFLMVTRANRANGVGYGGRCAFLRIAEPSRGHVMVEKARKG